MTTPPYFGLTVPSPGRTWSAGDIITVARLRGQMTAIAEVMCGGRPMLFAYCTHGTPITQTLASGSPAPDIFFTSTALNNWNVPVLTPGYGGTTYAVPLTGWYLLQSSVVVGSFTAAPDQSKFAAGFDMTQSGTENRVDGGAVTGSSVTTQLPGVYGAELAYFTAADPSTATAADTIGYYLFQNTGTTIDLYYAQTMAEFVAAPSGNTTTLVTPAAWPAGEGTYITGGAIAAGATSVTVNDTTGIVAGATIGLDVINQGLAQPVAESVTVSAVSGSTLTISATAYPHSQGAPVAVPVSAAFLNEQVRDIVQLLGYPPVLRAAQGAAQALAAQTLPAGTAITGLSTSYPNTDNYSGLSSSVYTAPVGGVYLVYGQVYLAGSTSTFISAAGVQVNSGTIQWGTSFRTATSGGAQSVCPWVQRYLRLSQGDTVTLYGSTNVAMDTVATAASNSRLICVWRSL